MQEISKALNWRYATKTFDATKKLSDEQLGAVIEAGRLAPSSLGIEPWKFFIVTNPEMREKIKAAAWNQSQVTDASHLIVIAAATNVDDAHVDKIINGVAETRGVSTEALAGYAGMMKNAIHGRSADELAAWNARQAYIPLGIMIETAAILGIDSCPMEGFDPKAVSEILGLDSHNATPLAFLTLGFRANEEESVKYKKFRLPANEIVIEIK